MITNKIVPSLIVYMFMTSCVTALDLRHQNILRKHIQEKADRIQDEIANSSGGNIILNEFEDKVNEILMMHKREEVNASFVNPEYFNFSRHYFDYVSDIKNSEVYKIIKKMPKGAALHIHSSMMLDADNMVKLTYEDNLFVCFENGYAKFYFSLTEPTNSCETNWSVLSELREEQNNKTQFDLHLRGNFTIYDEKNTNININKIWEKFDKVYSVIKSLISFRPVREKYFYQSLKSFYEDNILYIEIRTGLHELYELNGTINDKMYMLKMYERITNEFMQENPDFVGVKLILTKYRQSSLQEVEKGLSLARDIKEVKPNLFAGFDLVGQEDLGKPLSDFLPALIEAKDEINYYFHAGETNWFGMPTDENMFDAVQLGAKRIGHAYALYKYPNLTGVIKNNNICIEVNVISNVVLSLVKDLRNHPLSYYIASNITVTLSSDDPGVWAADPLSTDFYVAFVGAANSRADLKLLKQLAKNSIDCSSLDDNGKHRLYNSFNKKWNEFIRSFI